MIFCQANTIRYHEVKKGQIKSFGFGWCDICFLGQSFVKDAKNTLEHFLNDPNRTEFENWKNAEILENSVKSGIFGHSKRQKSAVFQDTNLRVCTHIHRQVSFHIYSF